MKKKSFVKQSLIAFSLGMLPQLGYADVSGMMTYQGYLLDASKKPVDGNIDIAFSIPSTNWAETHNGILVKQGVLKVLLGSQTSLLGVDFSQPRSLRITYNGSSQTVNLTSVGSAFFADEAQRVVEDQDTLGDLNCAKDQIAKHNGTAWECADAPKSSGGNTGGYNGSVFIRWGNGTAPKGTTLLYSGFGFNGHYSHRGGGAEAICMKAGDTGAPGPGSNYGDLLYPLKTGNAARMPPGISPNTKLKCAVCYAEGPSFEMWGSQTCPTGWRAAYKGYGMGAYYSGHNKSNRHCVDTVEYDHSVINTGSGAIWYGTVLWSNKNVGIYERNRYVQCAYCVKD
jgi:hypothetical protein